MLKLLKGSAAAAAAKTRLDSMRLLCVLGVLLLEMMVQLRVVMGGTGLQKCGFPAIYNFGDSNSDTGGISAALNEVTSPNGESFFGHPAGRFCDGRLIIDFIGK